MVIIEYMWDNPAIRSDILIHDPGADIWDIITKIMLFLAFSVLVPLIGSIFRLARILALKYKSTTPLGMIKYQLAEASNRYYISNVYYTDSVVDFLNNMYGYNNNLAAHCNPNDKKDTPVGPDHHPIAQKLISEISDLKKVFVQRDPLKDKELSEKMTKVALAGHAPRREAKDKIEQFILNETQPPCTCYHTQIARFIIKNQGKDGFEAQLTFVDKDGEKKKISDEILRSIAKRIMMKVDPSRIHDRTISLKKCAIHQTM